MSHKRNKMCIIIPAFNEETSIGPVLTRIKRIDRSYHIVVIDDGSLDNTAGVARKLGVIVIHVPFNLGIGGAVQTGLRYAKHQGFSAVVEIDADGQHDPAYIPQLVSALHQGADMAIGSRFTQETRYKASRWRRLGIWIFSWCIWVVTGKTIYDATSGFRAYNERAVAFLAENYPIDFPEPESIVKLLRHGFTISEIPVEMKQRTSGRSSVTRVKAVYFMISIVIAIVIEALKFKKSSYGTDH